MSNKIVPLNSPIVESPRSPEPAHKASNKLRSADSNNSRPRTIEPKSDKKIDDSKKVAIKKKKNHSIAVPEQNLTSEQQFDLKTKLSRFPNCCCRWHIKLGTCVTLVLLLVVWLLFTIVIGELGGAWGLLIALPLFAVYSAVIALEFFGIYTENAPLMLPYLVVMSLSILVYFTILIVLICLFAGVFGDVAISFIAVLIFIWALFYMPLTGYFLFAAIRCYRYVLDKARNNMVRTGLTGKR